jgi:hypothetical protein
VPSVYIIPGLTTNCDSPVRAAWEVDPDHDHHCLNEHSILLAANVQNVFTDFLAVATPVPVVCRLRVSKRQRTIVVGLFSLGLGAVAVGIYRTIYLHSVHDDVDFSWHLTTAFTTSTIELGLGLVSSAPSPLALQRRPCINCQTQIGSCAPALRPFLATLMPGLVQSSAVPTAPPPDTVGSSYRARPRGLPSYHDELYALVRRPSPRAAKRIHPSGSAEFGDLGKNTTPQSFSTLCPSVSIQSLDFTENAAVNQMRSI